MLDGDNMELFGVGALLVLIVGEGRVVELGAGVCESDDFAVVDELHELVEQSSTFVESLTITS